MQIPGNQQYKQFKWKGIDRNGLSIEGVAVSINTSALIHLLKKRKIILVESRRQFCILTLPNPTQISEFTHQLAMLLESGIPIDNALALSVFRTNNRLLQLIIHNCKDEIEAGLSFSTTLDSYPILFSESYRAVIRVGEYSGELPRVLKEMANNLERIIMTRNKIKKALSYPILVASISTIITVALLMIVVPQFESIYRDLNTSLPGITKALISTSHFLKTYGWGLPPLTILILFFIKRCPTTLLLKIPKLHRFIIYTNLCLWSRMMATLMNAAVPILDCLAISAKCLPNKLFQSMISNLQQPIAHGSSLSESIAKCPLIPDEMIQLITIGEASGQTTEMFERLEQLFQREIDNQLNHLSKWLEPVIMLVLGGIIGTIILAMYTPIFNLGMTL